MPNIIKKLKDFENCFDKFIVHSGIYDFSKSREENFKTIFEDLNSMDIPDEEFLNFYKNLLRAYTLSTELRHFFSVLKRVDDEIFNEVENEIRSFYNNVKTIRAIFKGLTFSIITEFIKNNKEIKM